MHHIFYSKLHLCIVTRAWPNLIKLRAPQDAKATQKTHPSTICNFQFIHFWLLQINFFYYICNKSKDFAALRLGPYGGVVIHLPYFFWIHLSYHPTFGTAIDRF